MVGDHLYVSTGSKPTTRRLVELAQKERCSVSGVHLTRESLNSPCSSLASGPDTICVSAVSTCLRRR
jgi:hypothetical protein